MRRTTVIPTHNGPEAIRRARLVWSGNMRTLAARNEGSRLHAG